MSDRTLIDVLDHWVRECPDRVWLRERKGDERTTWTWRESREQIYAAASWFEDRYGAGAGTKIAILSTNRAHWFFADLGIIASGNVTIPIFTTLPAETADYIFSFADVSALIMGDCANHDAVLGVLPEGVDIITMPGTTVDREHITWDEVIAGGTGRAPAFKPEMDTLISLVFTSGTTGVPKGVMQTHRSFVAPIERFQLSFQLRHEARFLSYLPLSHIAERQLVEGNSLLRCGDVTFNEGLPNIIRDLGETRPHFFFGPPRVWEQLQQIVLSQFGSQEALDAALAEDTAGVQTKVKTMLGFTDVDYLLTAAAPTPPALIHWFRSLGIQLLEGFGQTEAMGICANSKTKNKIGSIGVVTGDVDVKIGENDELMVRAEGLSPGYYNMPEKSAETFVDGWVHTGDKARIDEDGFIFMTGRVKDYFKTIQGKFVAPVPIEADYADNDWTEQICLLGRGYSKTVMVCVLSAIALEQDKAELEAGLRAQAEKINAGIDKHERIGAVIIAKDPWTIDNAILTPTMKIRRDEVEKHYGEQAQALATEAAKAGSVLVRWA